MIVIRPEAVHDQGAIASVTRDAFAQHSHGSQTEALVIDALRNAGALTASLVAALDGRVVGHVAFSPVQVTATGGGEIGGWHGLGPLAVLPSLQRRGIGSRLVREGLARLEAIGASGCVVLGEPDYYRRFGFASSPDLVADGLPPEYFMSLVFRGDAVAGRVAYHPAFFIAG